MSDRREQLEAELRLLGLEEEARVAKEAYRAKPTPKAREAHQAARDALVAARREQRAAEGRPEGTGVGAD